MVERENDDLRVVLRRETRREQYECRRLAAAAVTGEPNRRGSRLRREVAYEVAHGRIARDAFGLRTVERRQRPPQQEPNLHFNRDVLANYAEPAIKSTKPRYIATRSLGQNAIHSSRD